MRGAVRPLSPGWVVLTNERELLLWHLCNGLGAVVAASETLLFVALVEGWSETTGRLLGASRKILDLPVSQKLYRAGKGRKAQITWARLKH